MKKVILALIFSFWTIWGFSQAPESKNYLPITPTSAQLGRCGAVPVSYSNGTIPLYELKAGTISLPIGFYIVPPLVLE